MRQPSQQDAAPAGLPVSDAMKRALVLALAAALLVGVLAAVRTTGGKPNMVDFHVFWLAGKLALGRRLAEAYDPHAMQALQQAMAGRPMLIPWSYPPLFGVVMAPFAVLPFAAAFLAFGAASGGLYLAAMLRLDPRCAWPALWALAPCLVLNLYAGQNGLLTGALFALAAGALLRDRPGAAGAAIAGLAIKPHLAVLWPALLVAQRRWRSLAWAAGVAVALTAASLALAGPGAFKAFLAAAPDLARNMAAGHYPLNRMTSVYACALSLGVPAVGAFALHGAVAAAVMAGAARVGPRCDARTQIGLAVIAAAFVSPYFYDYDLALLGPGLALALPALQRRLSPSGLAAVLGLIALAEVVGVAFTAAPMRPSLGAPLLAFAVFAMLRALSVPAGQRGLMGERPLAKSGEGPGSGSSGAARRRGSGLSSRIEISARPHK